MSEEKEISTLERIHKAAMDEFLEKGFRAASLRNIVKTAGVTTGAFYGYYNSKEELFDVLVGDKAENVLNMMDTGLNEFERLPCQEQTKQMKSFSENGFLSMLDYVYDNYDSFRLLLLSAEGTKYADFVHRLVEAEDKSSMAYISHLRESGYPIKPINEKLVHMVESGFISGFFETVIHDMPRQEAEEYVQGLRRFYTAGWEELLGIKFG
ncbi:MAG: TetR/AcrR family transcriptional regulator [Huintestinicola sp.]